MCTPESKNARAGWNDWLILAVALGVLAAAVLPTISGAQARAKTAKVLTDFQRLAEALETYRADQGSYPPGQTDLVQYDLRPLTTPTAYIHKVIYNDVFNPRKSRRDGSEAGNKSASYFYFHLNGAWAERSGLAADKRTNTYIMESSGPDRYQDYVPQFAVGESGFGPEQLYDPTNGAMSAGDIAQWGGDPPFNPLTRQMAHFQKTDK